LLDKDFPYIQEVNEDTIDIVSSGRIDARIEPNHMSSTSFRIKEHLANLDVASSDAKSMTTKQ
jgi:hypothetical protein